MELFRFMTTGSCSRMSPFPDSPTAAESDYPRVQFWCRSQWKAHNERLKVMDHTNHGNVAQGKTAVSQGKNISTLYIEDENSHSVDGHRLTEICKLAQKVWNKFANIGQAPPTWVK